nr:uroporphyrinogen-III C-methyltransferase [Coralloluteibacterium stylophorae]
MEQTARLLEDEQRRLERRLGDASNGLRLVREEALAFSRRAELLEESVNQLSERRARGDAGLRLDEVELLLSLGRQRLELAGDIDAARRAYAAARDVLRNAEDPAYTNLRQSLEQELAALRAVGEDPRDRAVGELAALESALPQLPAPTLMAQDDDATAATPGTAERLLSRLVRVRRSDADDVERVAPAERAAALQALRVELTLARVAAERRDAMAFDDAIGRIETRLGHLFADTPEVRERRERLRALAGRPLDFEVPLLGSTLEQLRGLRLVEPAWAPASPGPADDTDIDVDTGPQTEPAREDAGAAQP